MHILARMQGGTHWFWLWPWAICHWSSLSWLESWEMLGWGPFEKGPGNLGKYLSNEISLIRLCQCEWVLGRTESPLKASWKRLWLWYSALMKITAINEWKRPGCQAIRFFLSCCLLLISLKCVFQPWQSEYHLRLLEASLLEAFSFSQCKEGMGTGCAPRGLSCLGKSFLVSLEARKRGDFHFLRMTGSWQTLSKPTWAVSRMEVVDKEESRPEETFPFLLVALESR